MKVHVNGVDLYYEEEGEGTPLILLSGYTVDLFAWSLTREELAKHFHIFMLDNRGVGRSDCPDFPFTIETMAEDVKAFIETLHLSSPHLLGHSMGGAIAQTLAFKYPHTLRKLILANTFIHRKEVPAFSLRYFLKMRSEGMPLIKMVEGSMPWLFSEAFLKDKKRVSEFLHFVETHPYPQSIIGQKRQLDAILQFNSEEWFKKISTPTLVIEGSGDIICPEDSKRLAEGIPHAKWVTFSDQAHMPHIEKPEEFVTTILDFLLA